MQSIGDRLNPFALPPETDTRFRLLIAAAVALGFNLFILSAYSLYALLLTDATGAPRLRLGIFSPQVVITGGLCGFTAYLLIILAAAIALYRTHPARLRRQGRLVNAAAKADPALDQALADLRGRAALRVPVTFYLDDSRRTDGQAFGLRAGGYGVRLGGRMRLLLRKHPGRFRAVVLHEVGHIINGDVGHTYFAQALWKATIVLALAPPAGLLTVQFGLGVLRRIQVLLTGGDTRLGGLLTSALPNYLLFMMQFAAAVAVFALLRAGLLRIREFYADWRAALLGEEDGLRQIFEGQAAQQKPGVFRLHPPVDQRLEALANPARLFRLTLDIPFFAGLLTAQVLSSGAALTIGFVFLTVSGSVAGANLLLEGGSAADAPLLTALVFASVPLIVSLCALVLVGGGWFVSGSAGLAAQRQALADQAQDQGGLGGYLRLLMPALLLALGLQLGFFITPQNYLFGPVIPLFGGPLLGLLLSMVGIGLWLIGFTAFFWAWMCLVRWASLHLLGRHTGTQPPHFRRVLLSLALGLIAGVLLLASLTGQAAAVFQATALSAVGLAPLLLSTLGLLMASGVLGAGLALSVLLAGLFSRARCAACGGAAPSGPLIGRACPHCGAALTPWLFV